MTCSDCEILLAELNAQIAAQGVQIDLLSRQNYALRSLYEELLHLCRAVGVDDETLDKFRQALGR